MVLFTNPSKGNEKGIVENRVGYIRRNYFVPKAKYKTIEELNEYLRRACELRREQKHHKEERTIGEVVVKEQEEFISLPKNRYECCDIKLAKVNSYSLVRYKTNDYSVPTQYAYKDVTLKAYYNKVLIFYKEREIAGHIRCFGKHEQSYNYLHYLPILSQKSKALDQAKPLQDLKLPEEFERLRRFLEKRYEGTKGRREYIKILELLTHHSKEELKWAISKVFITGAINIDAIKQVLHQKREVVIKSLDKNKLTDIPTAVVHPPSLKQYDKILINRSYE